MDEAQKEAMREEFKAILAEFSSHLLNKLMANEEKYGFGEAWKLTDWKEQLQKDLIKHVAKGDARDVAIYALFAWYHGWPTAPGVQVKP
jgi:hypothetical protein